MFGWVEIMEAVSGVGLALLFIQGFFAERSNKKWVKSGAFVAYGLGWGGLLYFTAAPYVHLAFIGVGLAVLTYCFYEVNVTQALFAGVLFCAVYGMTDIVFFMLLPIVTDTCLPDIMADSHASGIYRIGVHLILLLLLMVVLALTHRRHAAITFPFILMLLPGYVISIIAACAIYLEPEPLGGGAWLVSVGLMYMNVVAVIYAERIKQVSDEKREKELAEQHYAMQEAYYTQLRNEQNETRAMFHDIQKYMLAMRAMVQEQDGAQAKLILEETQALQACIGNVVDVGNPVISVILNEYKNKAEEAGIEFTYQVSIPSALGIAALDCYILLGNTLDNAMEAVLNVEEGKRKVHVQIKQHNGILFYQVENPFSPEHLWRKRGKQHGYGLRNVRRCAEKYGGDTKVSAENGQFVFSARLNIGS